MYYTYVQRLRMDISRFMARYKCSSSSYYYSSSTPTAFSVFIFHAGLPTRDQGEEEGTTNTRPLAV